MRGARFDTLKIGALVAVDFRSRSEGVDRGTRSPCDAYPVRPQVPGGLARRIAELPMIGNKTNARDLRWYCLFRPRRSSLVFALPGPMFVRAGTIQRKRLCTPPALRPHCMRR